MNTHSCFSAHACWKIAVARLRAGFTDVLSTGIVIRWIEREHQADGDAGEAGRHRLAARARDHEHEQRGEHDLGEDHRRAA